MKFYEDQQYIQMRLKAMPYIGKGDFIEYSPHCANNPSGANNRAAYVDYRGNFAFRYYDDSRKEKYCQLERQDQLQELATFHDGLTDYRPMNRLCRFWNWYWDNNINVVDHYDNNEICLEILWLAFIMFERFKKQWTGEDWK